MGLAEELIAIKMRLQGATSYQREMSRSAAATTEFGDAAERAGAQAKSGAVGIDAMNASSKAGVGAMARMKKTGEGLKSTGSKLTSAWTVPIAIIGGVGVKMALDFSDSMEQIATQAGASQGEVNAMTGAVMRFAESGKSASGPNDLANGLFRIESAGFRGKRAMDALVHSEELATVGHANLEKTSQAVAAAMATQIKGTKNLDETVGLMNSTVGIGSMRFEDLLSAMSTGLLDRAANFGLSLKEVGAALGTMTTVGQPAAASATRMAMAFNMMAAPTEKASKAMEGIGLNSQAMALSLRKRGLIPTLELLKSHLDKTFGTSKQGLVEQANAISEMFGGGRTSGGLVSLLRHVELLKVKQGELTGVQEKFHTALERTNAQPITKLHQAWAQLQVVLIQIGNKLIPIVTGIAKFFVSAAEWFSGLPKPAKDVLLILAGTLAVLGPILSLVGTMTLGIYGLAAGFEMLGGVLAAVDVEMAGLPILIGAVVLGISSLTGIFGSSSSSANRLANAQSNLKRYMEGQASAGHHLVKTEQILTKDRKKHKVAAEQFKQAQKHLTAVVHQYGKGSKPAIHAEQMLAEKRWSLIKATHALSRANRQHGIALQMTKQLAKEATLEARHEINLLQQKAQQFERLFTKEKNAGASNERLNQIAEWGSHANENLEKAHGKLNHVILEAAEKVGPKYAKFLHRASRETIEYGSAVAEAAARTNQIIEAGERINNIGRIDLGQNPLPPGSGLTPHHGHHKNTQAKASPNASVRVMRSRGGPTPTRAYTRRDGGAGGSGRGTPVQVKAVFQVGRRQFGEAMAMAMIDEDVNS